MKSLCVCVLGGGSGQQSTGEIKTRKRSNREGGSQHRGRRKRGQITPRLFEKASRNYISLYLPKIIHAT